MPFIGVIAKESESNFIKNEVLKNSVNYSFEFININKENLQNFKNIKFETVVINEDISEFLNESTYIENILKKAKYLIINSDIENNLELLKNYKHIITFGFNQQAMVTISSIEKENVLICIQKNIQDINGEIVEQQEVNIEIGKNSLTKSCNLMVIFTILTIYVENFTEI